MMSVPEAAKSLGLAPATVRAQIRNGKIKAKKLARDWFITEAEVMRYRSESLRDRGPISESELRALHGDR